MIVGTWVEKSNVENQKTLKKVRFPLPSGFQNTENYVNIVNVQCNVSWPDRGYNYITCYNI